MDERNSCQSYFGKTRPAAGRLSLSHETTGINSPSCLFLCILTNNPVSDGRCLSVRMTVYGEFSGHRSRIRNFVYTQIII
jgi:hypothetical protein